MDLIGSTDLIEKLNSECAKCIDCCIESLELAEQESVSRENQVLRRCNISSSFSNSTSDDAVIRKPSNTSRSIRRQKLTSRKKSSTVNKAKIAPSNKKAGKCEITKSSKTSPCTTRRRNNQLDQQESTTGKKLRKGYVYEVVPADVPTQPYVLEKNLLLRNGRVSPICCERGTQTIGASHFFAMLMEQLVNDQANMNAGSTRDMPINLPSYVSRRLLVTKQLLIQQSAELNKICEENSRLHEVVSLLVSVTRKFRDEYATDLRRLRDSIEVLKREFSFYQEEFVAEAEKSVDNIKSLKEQFQRRMEEFERKNRLLNARIDLHIKEKEAAEELADSYLRDISARDRDVILANKARDKAERKLQDSLYVANNAKCAHCQISDKMRTHLTSAVAEKTIMLEKCQKECSDLQRRADQADRISKILSKDGEKLRFELNTWKSDAERNALEISRLKEELKKTTAGPSSNSFVVTQSHSRDKDGGTTIKDPGHSNSPATRMSIGKATPNDYDSSVREQVDGHALQPPPAPPIMSAAFDETNSPWTSKERRPSCSPSASLSSTTSSSKRHTRSTITWRKTPFNGPFISDHSTSKLNTEAISPSSLIDGAKNNACKSDNTPEDHASRASYMSRPSNAIIGDNEIHMHGRSNQSKEKHDSAYRTRDSRGANNRSHAKETRSPLSVENMSRESRKRRSSESSRYERIRAADQFNNHTQPFVVPIPSESSSSDSRALPQYSSQIRGKISSSPLPWHRVESRAGYKNTREVTDMSATSPYHNVKKKMYNGERFHDKSVKQRPRRNFWEP